MPVGEGAKEGAFEDAGVFGAVGLACGGGAAVAVGGEFEELRFGLAEALGAEAEDGFAEFDGEDAADEVAVFAPEVEGAAVVLGGEGVAGGTHVEEGVAVFEEGGGGVFGEEGFESGGDLGWGLGGSLEFGTGGHGGDYAPGFVGGWTKSAGGAFLIPTSQSERWVTRA